MKIYYKIRLLYRYAKKIRYKKRSVYKDARDWL